jgi:uncharacterized protein
MQEMSILMEYLIVDGYNIKNGWTDLKEETTQSLESARIKLIDIMSRYNSNCGI